MLLLYYQIEMQVAATWKFPMWILMSASGTIAFGGRDDFPNRDC